jgi:hypothetical protein
MPNSSQVLLLFLDRGHSAIETSDSHRKPSVPMLFGQDKLTQKSFILLPVLFLFGDIEREERQEKKETVCGAGRQFMWRRKTVGMWRCKTV